jgi:hypothetical protein
MILVAFILLTKYRIKVKRSSDGTLTITLEPI